MIRYNRWCHFGSRIGVRSGLVSAVVGGASAETWTPAQITTGVWLDAADASTVTVSDGIVSQWADKSGNSRHASQSQNARKPMYDSANRRIQFDGDADDDHLLVSPGWGTEFEMFFVYKHDVTNVTQVPLRDSQPGFVSTAIVGYPSTNTDFYRVRDTSSGFSTDLATEFGTSINIVGFSCRSGNTTKVFRNGEERVSFSATGNIGSNLYLGTNSGFDEPGLIGSMNELIILPSSADNETRQIIEGYLAHKWGIAASLPAGHPYASAAPLANPLLALFANGEAGTLLDFTDVTSFRVERDGASSATQTPVDDVVGTWLDQSGNGAHAIALNDATRAVLRQDATSLYIEYNAVNTELICTVPDLGRNATMWIVQGNVISIQPIRKSAGTFSLPKCHTRAFGLIDRALTSDDITILENHYGMTADVWDFIVTDNAELSFSSLVARTDGPQFEAAVGGTSSVWFDSEASLPFSILNNTLVAFRTSGTFTYISELPGVIDIGQMPEGVAEFHSLTEGYVEGNVSDIPDSMHTLVLRGGHDVEAASPDFSGYTSFNRFTLENEGGSTTSEIDAFLNGLANIPSWTGSQLIEMNYTDDELRSSASDAAVATLEGLGVTVNVKDAASQPSALFANGEAGVLLDFTEGADFRMERTGASAATETPVDDVVGTWLDKSGSNAHAIAPNDAARPILRQDGTSRYIEHNGVNSEFICTVPDLGRNATMWIYNDLGLSIQAIRKSAGEFRVPRCNMRGFGLIDRALTADDIALLEAHYGVTHETWDFMMVYPGQIRYEEATIGTSGPLTFIDWGNGETSSFGGKNTYNPGTSTVNNLVRMRNSGVMTSFRNIDGIFDAGQVPDGIGELAHFADGPIYGNVADFPDNMWTLLGWGPSYITGSIGSTASLSIMRLTGSNTVGGLIDDIQPGLKSIFLSGNNNVSAVSPTFSSHTSFNQFEIQKPGGLTTAEIDAILIGLASITSWSGDRRITMNYTNDEPRSTASDAAVATLQSNGVTVNVKPPV